MNRIHQLLLTCIICVLLLYLYTTSDPIAKTPQVTYLSQEDEEDVPNSTTEEIPNYTMNIAKQCTRVNNFAFVKTHKTGSSTMCNILLRYTETHNLNQLLAVYPAATEYHNLVSQNFARPPSGEIYNAFVMHAEYNYQFLMSKLPKDTQFFTFVRQPVKRYLSAFNFFQYYKKYNNHDFDDAIQQHLQANKDYLKSSINCKSCMNTVNSVARDLGFNFPGYMRATNKARYITEFLEERDKEIQLTLITEYFDLSLVLLKRKFCWSWDDLVYLRSLESLSKPFVSEETMQKVLEFQEVDAAIYTHYNKTFWEMVNAERGILDDLSVFKRVNEEATRKCVADKEIGPMKTWKYKLTDYGRSSFQCLAMNTRVLQFSHLIQKRNQGIKRKGRHGYRHPYQPDKLTTKRFSFATTSHSMTASPHSNTNHLQHAIKSTGRHESDTLTLKDVYEVRNQEF